MKILPEAVRFGQVIRRVRRQRGLTIVQMAQRSGLSASYLGVLEQGGNDTTLSTIVKLCQALDADIGEIMREVAGVGKPPQPQ